MVAEPTSSKKTGLLFGSFNPIHNGHLIIAQYMLQFAGLREIWFVVSPHNPLKRKHTLLDDHHRLAMVNVAIEDNYSFRSSNIEFKLPKPSYTIDTLTYLTEKYTDREFVIIAGSDILSSFTKWKNYEQLLEYYRFYIYPRPGGGEHGFHDHPSIVFFSDAPLIEISASFIRDAIAGGKDMRYFLPDKVREYIEEMHFYSTR